MPDNQSDTSNLNAHRVRDRRKSTPRPSQSQRIDPASEIIDDPPQRESPLSDLHGNKPTPARSISKRHSYQHIISMN
jgi:hypothetical protein